MHDTTGYYDIHVDASLVAQNGFIDAPVSTRPIPSQEAFAAGIPTLIWPSRPDAVACYDYAWKRAWMSLRPADPMFPEPYIDTCFNGNLFLWDSAFILQFGKYGERAFPFFGTLDDLYRHQHRDGFICREIDEKTGRDRFERFDPSSTGPNILAWSEWERYRLTADAARLRKIYPVLAAYHLWLRRHRTWQDGTYFTSGWGSGMDNLPRQEAGASREFDHGHLAWIDATAQQALSCETLLRIGAVLGEPDTRGFRAEYEHLGTLIQRMWDPATGFFYDTDRTGRTTGVMTVGSYWVMMAGLATQEQADAMVARLFDPRAFEAPMVIPALAAAHPECDDDYWRGGVWVPATYMVLRALERYGYHRERQALASRHTESIVQEFTRTGMLHEVYQSKTGRHQPGAREHFVGWTGLAPIAMTLEDVFGIRVDALERTVVWHRTRDEVHGVAKLPIGTGTCSLLYDPKRGTTLAERLVLSASVPMTLLVIEQGRVERFRLSP